jgi:transcriptional regulator GlxA family with amidase domain
MRLAVLITQHHRLLSLAAILDVFDSVNRFYKDEEKPPFFEIELIGNDRDMVSRELQRKYIFTELETATSLPEMVLVPAFSAIDPKMAIQDNVVFAPLLLQCLQRDTPIASFCTGAFLLAGFGLLDQKKATTHIDARIGFTSAFPKVKLVPHAVFTKDGELYTSGGATNSFQLKLLLIEKFCGRAMAIRVAKLFAIDMDRESQLYFENFNPIPVEQDKLVKQLQLRMKQDYNSINSLEEVMDDLPSSRRNLIRRFKHSVGMTPIKYLQYIKIEAAKRALEETDLSIMEVMLTSGYTDMKNFRNLFKKITGLTPKAYRDKFAMQREVAI